MSFQRYGAVCLAMLITIGIGRRDRAEAQVYAPNPGAQPVAAPFTPSTVEGTGNPFMRRGPSRASQMQLQMPSQSTAMQPMPMQPVQPMRYDDQVAPASYVQPIAAAPQPVAPQPVAPPMPVAPEPQPFVPSPNAAPLVPQPPQQQLRGVAILWSATEPGLVPNEHPLAPILRWAEDALQQGQGLNDYSCTFTKRERVDGRLQEQQVMYAKVRHQPYSVYLQFLAPNDVKGQEALYVEGQNQGRLLAHPVGFKQALVGTLSLLPNDPQAMAGNLHPITDFGVRRLVERYREGVMRDMQFGECNVRVIPGAQVGDRACTCIEVNHPVRRAEFKYHLTHLYVDNELNLPIHYESYDWPAQPGAQPQLLEDYTYQGLRPNVGLSNADFDTKNPNYRF